MMPPWERQKTETPSALTSVLLLLAAAPAPDRPAPGAAVIPGFSPVRRLLGGAFEPGSVSSGPRRHRGGRLEASAELHHPQVGQPRPLCGRGAARAPWHRGLPGETGVQENQAARRQVQSQQSEETHGFAPKIPLEFQQKLGHSVFIPSPAAGAAGKMLCGSRDAPRMGLSRLAWRGIPASK